MKIIFYRYGSICEPDVISAFTSFGITVIEEKLEMYSKSITNSECIYTLHNLISAHNPSFVFSINFFPLVSEVCYIHNTLYLCWSVDSPLSTLFTTPILHPTNRIFLFDKSQYERFHLFNPDCIFHLPLASAVNRFDSVIQTITRADINKYSSDITFVGSLYSEKNPLKEISSLSDFSKGYIDGIIESSLLVYGYNFIEEVISEELKSDFFSTVPIPHSTFGTVENPERYILAHEYIGYQIAEIERIRTLNQLALHFPVTLYTNSDTTPLSGVNAQAPIETLLEMPKAFHLSKINLNITIKPIQTGLPLRLFDILGCGGFALTNYQLELEEHFTIGEDLESYSCMEELIDKCHYYLQHEEERKKISHHGYETIKKYHNYPLRISELIQKSINNM